MPSHPVEFHTEEEATLAIGTVKWYSAQRGFGFVLPSDGSKDVFVHVSALERAGIASLNEGQKISYELANERGKTKAVNIALAD
jgi:CspA family cold shock protein